MNPSIQQTDKISIKLSDLQIEEKLAKTQMKRNMFHRLIPLIQPVKHLIIALIVVEFLQVLTIFVRPWVIKYVLDSGFIHDGQMILLNYSALSIAITVLLLSWIFRFGFAGLSKYLSAMTAVKVINQLRQRIFDHVQDLHIGYFDKTKAGRIISRADRDVDTLEPVLVQGPPELLSAILRCSLASVLLWHIYPPFFWTLFSIIPVLFFFTRIFKRISQKRWGKVAEERSKFTAHLVETVNGVKIIQQMGFIEKNGHKYKKLLHDFNQSIIQGSIRTSWFAPFTGWLAAIGTASLLIVGSDALNQGHITVGQFAESIFYVFLFLAPLQELTDLFDRYSNGTACAQRIFLLLDTQPEIQDQANALKLNKVQGNIRFSNVNFAYTSKPVLKNLSLSIEAGQTVAIVGPTGHGKSTIVQLLTRFYEPQQGEIYIDRYSIKDIQQQNLRQHMSIVLQENVLFSGTVLDNLRLVCPSATDNQLIQAIEDLGADDILQELTQGYQTEVGVLGANISQGQRQLICLVRAYLANPKILILDEATSAIDIYTEQKIQQALRKLCQDRTCIIIAHRLSTIREADKIVVIENGQAVEEGSHTDLIQQKGHYHLLYDSYQQNQIQF